jgi:peptide methionine sulfoxide reductase MsrA
MQFNSIMIYNIELMSIDYLHDIIKAMSFPDEVAQVISDIGSQYRSV